MRRTMKRVVASVLSIAIFMTQSNVVYIQAGQESIQVVVEKNKGNTRKLTFYLEDVDITKAQILLDNEVLEEKEIAESNFFEVYTNGTFTINGLDKDGSVIASVQQEVNDFEEITLSEDKNNHSVEILSRIKESAYAEINGEQDVSLDEENGTYKENFSANKNGTYRVSVFNQTGSLLGKKEIVINSNDVVRETGAIEIQKASDLEKIVNNPSGSFILTKDIEVTKDILANVGFSGTLDGNGYSIKGIKDQLFQSLQGATIKNITIYGGGLAQKSSNTNIVDSGFYLLFEDEKEDSALILESDNTTIQGSFVLANIKAKNAAGFVLEGSASINDSYVSGYINGSKVYGFGKDVEVYNSYLNASLIGKERVLFTKGKQDKCFYDIQINDIEDDKATLYTTKELVKGDLKLEKFVETKGQYPQIKAVSTMKEEAKKLSLLSSEYVQTDSHLRALEETVKIEEQNDIAWDSTNVKLSNARATLVKEEGEIIAKSNDAINRFSLKQVSAINTITAGESSTEELTQITYPTVKGTYYKVLKELEMCDTPKNHKEAIENGWKVVYWTGVNREDGVLWNTVYTLYSTNDFETFNDKDITTKKRTIAGELVLEGTYAIGEEMKVSLKDVNGDVSGHVYWEYASTLDATNWTPISDANLDAISSSTITIDENQYFKYVRARFVVDETNTNYQGELTAATDAIVKKPIEEVLIKNVSPAVQNQISVQDKLYATIKPTGSDSEVTFKWYRATKDGNKTEVGSGKNYTVLSQDVGSVLYVIASAKATGDLNGDKKSDDSTGVEAIKFKVPETNLLSVTASEDTTMTLSFNGDGLYAIQYNVKGNDVIQQVDAYVRGGTNITLVGLEADTTYQFSFRRVGENGCLDSDWTGYEVEGKTQLKNVQGDVSISGDAIFDHTLTASVTDGIIGQTGSFVWYRLDADGKRDGSSIGSGETYTLTQDDINHKIEAVFKGENTFAGEISMVSDRIKQEVTDKPESNVSIVTNDTTDTKIKVSMPENTINRNYNLGYSDTKDGIPKVFEKDGKPIVYNKATAYEITTLQRDSTYYFFVRYAETSTHEKSEWVDFEKEANETTKKTTFDKPVEFTYETVDASLMSGQRLIAKIKDAPNDLFNYNGEWKWFRVDGSDEQEIFDYALSDDKTYTYYDVPSKENVGIKYKATYTVNIGFDGTQSGTSKAVEAFKKTKYETPDENDIEIKILSDSKLSISLKEGAGRYKFRYKKNTTNFSEDILDFLGIDDGYTEIENSYYSNVDITIDNLDRNTAYVVEVSRIEDDGGTESDWSASTSSVLTAKTDISGSVQIGGIIRTGETLTAIYESATYTPSGVDTGGTWKWYRDNVVISGQTSATYKLTNSDVGKRIKAEYTAAQNSDFTNNAIAITDIINKAVSENPMLTIEKSDQKADDSMYLSIKNATISDANQSTYYFIQKTELPAPNFPTTEELNTVWKKITTKDFNIEKDSLGQAVSSNGEYTLYAIKTETAYMEASGIARFTTKVGMPKQTGTISLTSGNVVVGKSIEAKLSDNANNKKKGKWKWYRSLEHRDTQVTVPAISDASKWVEIPSGYSPSRDSATSTLNLTADLWGYYLYAEFIASEEDGYTGTIKSTDAKYVKRILEETLTYTTNTHDGYGNNKIYQGSVMTGTVNNCYETGDINTNRKTVEFRVGTSTYDITSNSYKDNKMWRTSISENIGNGGNVVRAAVTMPKRYYLYTNDRLVDYSDDSLVIESTTSTNTSAVLVQGASIKNNTDMKQFMLAQGDYTDRTKEYVIASNIKMNDADKLELSQYQNLTAFSGILNGDFHTITNLRNMMFYNITGTSSKYAEIKNLLAYNADIRMVVGGTATATGLFSSVGSYMRFNQVFLMDSYLEGSHNTGYFVGRPTGGVEILNSGSAGGTCTVNRSGASFGGIVGFIGGGVTATNIFKNISTLGTDLNPVNNAIPNDNGGIVGGVSQTSSFVNVYTNNDVAITNSLGQPSTKTGTIAGTYSDTYATYANAYYNWDSIKNKAFPFAYINGTQSNTKDMIGTKLKSGFDAQSANTWTYKNGYYPTLSWVKDHPIVNMYTATTGAFLSIDSKTTQDQLESGKINGAISTPQAFQTKDYVVQSSNESVLKVLNNTIVPVGNVGQSADITVTYTQPDTTIGGSAKNSYTFTVANKMGSFTSAKVNGEASYGATLSALAEGATATGYQWYRRKGDSGTPEKISGATNRTHTLKIEDIGYQFSVVVSGSNVASVMSTYTNTTIAQTPTDQPIISNITDGSVLMSQEGLSGATYEYAYADATTPDNKIMLQGTYSDGAKVTVDKLSRNTTYNFYARVAGEKDLYDPSAWGPASTYTTLQTDVSSNIIINNSINNATTLTMFIEATNGQTGTWTLDRMSADGTTFIEPVSFTSNNLSTSYTFTADDVGKKIRVTFTATGDFKGAKVKTTEVVKKSVGKIPNKSEFTSKSVDERTISVKLDSTGSYDYAYSTSLNGTKTIALTSVEGKMEHNITSLAYNTSYYVFARASSNSGEEASDWTDPIIVSTPKCKVSEELTITGSNKTAGDIVFRASDVHSQVGTWKLERISTKEDGTSSSSTISSKSYTVSDNTHVVTYRITPNDASTGAVKNTIKATFIGTGDYTDSITKTSGEIVKEKLTKDGLDALHIEITSLKDIELRVKSVNGTDLYQFGIALAGQSTVDAIAAVVEANRDVIIDNLSRNTEYDIYIRKADITGYTASDYVKVSTTTTQRTALNGNMSYTVKNTASESVDKKVGTAYLGFTYDVTYTNGTYSPAGNDDQGHWQWYADGVKIPDAYTSTYVVATMVGNPEITARYIANESSNFKGYREVSIGKLTKPTYVTPKAPVIEALAENKKVDSELKISSDEIEDVYWYIQKANVEALPTLVPTKDASSEVKENVWFKANSNVIATLDPNTEYVVYAARLEDGEHNTSAISSQRAVKTVKDNLKEIGASITEANTEAKWKVLQGKELRVVCDDNATDGAWQYYVKAPGEDTKWNNINSEVKSLTTEGKTTSYAYTRVGIPLKYLGYSVKVEYRGVDSYTGTITYEGNSPLVGTLLKGSAQIENANLEFSALSNIKADYVCPDGVAIDDLNGTWTWYREVSDGNYEKIERDYDTVGVSDTYQLTSKDVDKRIYAIYTASKIGEFTGEVKTSVINNITRADQNKPDTLTRRQVNGNHIQVNLPTNYKQDGTTIPEVVLGYKKASETEIQWLDAKDETWMKDVLAANTEYEIYAKFTRTSEFKESDPSEALVVTTGNKTFDQKKLTVEADAKLYPSSIIKATFTGTGYNEGHYVIKRSDGEEITTLDGTIDTTDKKNSVTYTCTSDDIGANIVVSYEANEKALNYGGKVSKTTKVVQKPIATAQAIKPELLKIKYEETKLQLKVNEAYEYALSETERLEDITAGQWQKREGNSEGNYTFTDLDKTKSYYLFARVAETQAQQASKAVASDNVQPWNATSYAIAYNLDGGTNHVDNPKSYTELEEYTLKEPTKVGYTFTGWTSDKTTIPNKSVIITRLSEGNKTFKATWSINTYDVTYHSNGDNETPSVRAQFNTKLSEPEKPTKIGHTFRGWYLDSAFNTPWDFDKDKVVANNIDLYAKWSVNQYVITFDSQGGTTIGSIEKAYDTQLGALPVPTRDGYDFMGWYTKALDGSRINEQQKVTDRNAKYYARWGTTSYSITFDEKGGSYDSGVVQPQSYTIEDADIEIKEPVREGYVFTGWTYDGQNVPKKNVNITAGSVGDKSFVANWKVQSYSITYELNSGTNDTSNPTSYTIEDEEITFRAPSKKGFAFVAWTPSNKIAAGSTGDKVFEATWKTADSIVKFNSQGGSDVADMEVAQGAILHKPNTPSKIGYTFTGWYKEKSCDNLWNFENEKLSGTSLTLYAGWKVTEFTVQFIDFANPANNVDVTYAYGSDLASKAVKFVRHGYTLSGWLNDAGDKVSLTETVYKSFTLKADWKLDVYDISYVLNDGINHKDNPNSYTVESNKIELKDAYRKDFVFAGWEPKSTIDAGSTGKHTFTAKWEDADYDVTFISNGGSEVLPLGAKANQTIDAPTPPTKLGFTFAKWYKNKECNDPWNFESNVVSSNTTLYAGWNKDVYEVTFDADNSSSPSTILKEYNATLGELPVVSKVGYVFAGWYDESGTKALASTIIKKAITFKAKWTAEVYNISYELNEGSNHKENPKTYTIESEEILLKNPTRSGYVFNGWTPTNKIPTKSTGSQSFEATWKQANAKVTFDSQGGSIVSELDALQGYTLEEPVSPTRVGYTFAGWYLEQECITKWNFSGDLITKDIKLFAAWKANVYKAEFITIPDGSAENEIINTYGEELGALPTVTRNGYEFIGWYTKQTSGSIISSSTTITKDVTYYAHWKAKQYKISYNLNGGTNHRENIDSYTIESERIVLKAPTNGTNVFVGWSYEGQVTPVKEVIIPKGSTGNVAYKANWKKSDWTITFDTMDGSIILNQYVSDDDYLTRPDTPSRVGYTFDGWYKDTDYNTAWNFTGDKVSTHTTLYAKWNKNTYKVQFDAQGGSKVEDIQRLFSEAIGNLPTPIKNGYTFAGWYSGNSKISETTLIREDSTYKAKWVAKEYAITYKLKDGINHKSNVSTYTVESKDITLLSPTKKDHAFLGWIYEGQDTAEKNVTIVNGSSGDKTFEAVWANAEVKVDFDSKDGTKVTTYYGMKNDFVPIPDQPTKRGYTFKGWYKEDTFRTPWNFEVNTVSENIILYAKWEINQYTATFDVNGGKELSSNTIKTDYNQALGTLPTPVRSGYSFDGWYSKAVGGTRITSETKMTAENVIYYAHWTLIKYQISYVLDGGENASSNPAHYSVESEDITLQEPLKVHYQFDGWTWKGQSKPTKSVVIQKGTTGEKEYQAHWSKSEFKVQYNSLGGSKIDSRMETKGQFINQPTKPTKIGYTFMGWYKEEAIVNAWNFDSDRINEDITLYARWVFTEYRVVYDVSGGNKISDKQGIHWSDKNLLPISIPTRVGYQFIAWIDEQGNRVDSNTTYQGIAKQDNKTSITLKAVWQKVETPIHPLPQPNPNPVVPNVPTNPVIKPTPSENEKEPISKETTEEKMVVVPGVERKPEAKAKGTIEKGVIQLEKGAQTNNGNGNTIITIGDGKLNVNISSNVEVEDVESFINAVLTTQQKENLVAGASIEIRMNVKEYNALDNRDVELIKSKANEMKLELGTIFDVSITVKEDDLPWMKVEELQDGVKIILPVEKKLQDLDADFYAIRIHKGESVVLKDEDQKKETVSVKTNLFSTYAIAYKLKTSKEGTSMTIYYITGAGVIAVVGTILYLRKKQKRA